MLFGSVRIRSSEAKAIAATRAKPNATGQNRPNCKPIATASVTNKSVAIEN